MLDPQEKAVFDGLVTQLRVADPQFCRRVDRMGRPRTRLYTTMAFTLWALAPMCIVFGGWTGALFAVIFIGYGLRLYTKRNGSTTQPPWWAATRGSRTNPA
ncbi:MAG TPA: DUF3040 domain-containing protein [Actinoplanes sp.]|nr:DUF3040 domain-containing protein [Actinoplanes sp.]